MKKIKILVYLCLLYSLGLHSQSSFIFRSSDGMSEKVTGCTTIQLLPGFTFKADQIKKLTLNIDPSNCDPYNGKATATSSDQNYIRTRTFTNEAGDRYLDQIAYFDGLGRPEQTVQRGITPNGSDLVSYQEYDPFGRESNSWLPGVIVGNNGAFVPLDKVVTASKATNTNNGVQDANPYAKPVYEASPLNRILEQYGPGADWHAKKKAVRTGYLTNVETGDSLSCILYTVTDVADTISLTKTGMYKSNMLYVTRMLDEDGNRSYEFKDKQGQVVLTRQMDGNTPFDTYYIYDDFGNLRLVLPPLAADQLKQSINAIAVKDYAYIYKYDNRNRCIAKKLPGAGWTRYIYDRADRLIFSQDGEQHKNKEWLYTIPDVFGRIVLTGICKDTDMQLAITTKNYEQTLIKADYNKSNTAKDIKTSYTLSQAIFKSGIGIPGILTINFYDSYDFLTLNGFSTLTYSTAKESEGYGKRFTQGYATLLTGTVTAVFDTPTGYLYSAMYYDSRKRVIQAKATNHLGGMEEEYIAYSFTGLPVKKQLIHTAKNKDPQNEIYAYTYDHAGRLKTTTHQLNGKGAVTLASNGYDELGRLQSVARNGQAKLTASYRYNVRGWTKSISSPLFIQTLSYNEADGTNKPQYGGNISAMSWVVDSKTRSYRFTYDALSRLIDAGYTGIGNEKYSTWYTYDKHGNMSTLIREGKLDTGDAIKSYGVADQLLFSYNGNQLKNIYDDAADITMQQSADFKDQHKDQNAVEYYFNALGSMTKDLNKGILGIDYNSLNLPREITIKNSSTVGKTYYTYAASGVKLRAKHLSSFNMTIQPMHGIASADGIFDLSETTDYAGNVIYENGSLKRILVDGGYIEGNVYHFYLTDHLGNNRMVVKGDGTPVQTNHYYPFGMAFAEASTEELGKQPYRYNGKELVDKHGLNLYDYAARHMEPAIGRFTTVDPHAEKYYSWSPYAYVGNNPINAIDPDGRLVIFINGQPTSFGEAGTKRYWGKDGKFADNVMAHLNDYNAIYLNGSVGRMGIFSDNMAKIAGYRKNNGYKAGSVAGKYTANQIINLISGGKGKNHIKETIKIITHSMGGAYAKGYVEALLEYFNKNGIDPSIIEFEADFAPFQPEYQKAVDGIDTYQYSHSKDPVAGNKKMPGAEYKNTSSDKDQGHSINSFYEQINNLATGKYKVENGKIIPI